MPLKAEQTAPTFPRKEIPAASRKVEKKIRVSIVFKIGCFPLPFPSVREKSGVFAEKIARRRFILMRFSGTFQVFMEERATARDLT